MVENKLIVVKETKKILLQNLAQKHRIELDEYDLEKFSAEKSLLDYQKEALENAFSILNLYFKKCDGDREKFYAMLDVKDSLDIKLDKDDLLKEYFQTKNSRFEFSQIANQMCFWMATGSGKTIVIIKLIEMLSKAMENKLIPPKDIFFFSANDDLLEAFEREVKAYNNSPQNNSINCYSLKDYEKEKANVFGSSLTKIFLYNAYNLSGESKEKQLSYKEVWNNGNNYVILDEAHKGNKSYSKMQHIMNILSKNGFLFNFSATFTSSQDIAMTVLNLNVSEWIKKGYGKKPILLDSSDLSAFKEKEDFNENVKQKAILKALIALYLCKIARIECQKDAYHDPMMLVFANSVTAENSDAHIFFKTLKNVVDNDNEELFEEAKEDMKEELKKKNYLITDDEGGVESLSEKVPALTLSEIKEQVFHSASGNLEAIYYPSNTNEILLKLDSTEAPFMLIRIGNIIEWLKVILTGIKISKSHKDLEAFKNIDNSKINILLGSRMFSEGWDTTRPNVTLFLNIGVDKEAKTFVMQSLGRTLRIESFDKDRKRAGHIEGKNVKAILELETSFIFATNPQAIKAITDETKKMGEANDKKATIKLEKNPLIPTNLLIPKYKKKKTESNKISQASKMSVSEQNIKMAEIYAKNTPNALMALRHNIVDIEKVKLIKTLCNKSNFNESKDKHYKNINTLINEVQKRSYVNEESLDGFKELENEIIHYERIEVNEDDKDKIEEEIKEVLNSKKSNGKYKYLEKHYYRPLICANVDWKHIIKVESEIKFIEALIKLSENEDLDKKVKSWHFSKIDEHLDKVYLPYIEEAKDKKFYPDFIFWIEKNDGTTKIVFVDPKGTENTSYQMKCNGFDKVFKDYKKSKHKKIEVQLLLVNVKNNTSGKVAEEFKELWIDVGNSNDLMKIFS